MNGVALPDVTVIAAALGEVYEAVAHRLPTVAALVAGERRDLAEAVRRGLRLSFGCRAATEARDLEFLLDFTRRLARRGMPAHEYVACQELCGTFAASAVWTAANPHEFSLLAHSLGRAAERYRRVATECLRVFLDEAAGGVSGRVAPSLAGAALHGRFTPSLAAAAGVPYPAAGYLVCVLPASVTVVARLERVESLDPLWYHADGELILLSTLAGGAGAARERVERLLLGVRRHVEPPAVGLARSLSSVADGVRESRRLRAYAVAASLSDLLYGPDVLLVDRCVAEHAETAAGLRASISALPDGTELRHTLRTLYGMDLHRARTAAVLGVHRRTLAYRLDRIAELTGFDPLSVRGVVVLSAALAADHLTAQRMPT